MRSCGEKQSNKFKIKGNLTTTGLDCSKDHVTFFFLVGNGSRLKNNQSQCV